MLPRIDLSLAIAGALAFAVLFGLALAVRPELRDGRKLSRETSYAVGMGVFVATLLALETWRGAACDCWRVTVPQLWLDVVVILVACAAATMLHRLIFGQPRRGNPHRDLRHIAEEAKKLTDGIDTDGN